MANPVERFYVGCTNCGWTTYRKGGEGLAKPCPRCDSPTEVKNRRREGKRGPTPGPIKHGTRQGFGRGCRCKQCVAAERDYQRLRYAERKGRR